MSRIREAHRRLIQVLRRELRREDEEVREELPVRRPNASRAGKPEIDDLPLGVPPEPTEKERAELPGFPRDDPSHG